MHKDLINAYAHGNLQEALLVRLYVEMLKIKHKQIPNDENTNDEVIHQSLKMLRVTNSGISSSGSLSR